MEQALVPIVFLLLIVVVPGEQHGNCIQERAVELGVGAD